MNAIQCQDCGLSAHDVKRIVVQSVTMIEITFECQRCETVQIVSFNTTKTGVVKSLEVLEVQPSLE